MELPHDSNRVEFAELYADSGRLHWKTSRLQEATYSFERAVEQYKPVPEQKSRCVQPFI